MSERLTTSEDFFDRYLTERVVGKEHAMPQVAALSIAGLTGSGITSTARELSDIAARRLNKPVYTFSSSDFALIKSQEKLGHKTAHILRDAQTIHETDVFMLDQLIDPSHAGSLIVAEGRLTPFLMTGLRQAAARRNIPLPFDGLGVYLFATEPVRHSRKYLDAVKSEPTLDFEQFRSGLRLQAVEEQRGFIAAYPQLLGHNPNSMAFQYRGDPVYSLRFDTTTQRPYETALGIFENDKVQDLLHRTQIL